MGLRFKALIGHGAGYGVYDKLKESVDMDVNYFFNVDPISIWLTNEKALNPISSPSSRSSAMSTRRPVPQR